MRLLVLMSVVAAGDALGPALRQDGYALRPPREFHLSRMDLFHGTRVGAISARGDTPRYLSAALVDGDGEDAASLLISVVESDFSTGAGARDALGTEVVKHFQDELETKFAMASSRSSGDRVEVDGTISEGTRMRHILAATWPGTGRHVVVLASVPEVRWSELRPVLHESLDTMRIEAVGPTVPTGVSWGIAALLGALLLGSIGLWRRRQKNRAADAAG